MERCLQSEAKDIAWLETGVPHHRSEPQQTLRAQQVRLAAGWQPVPDGQEYSGLQPVLPVTPDVSCGKMPMLPIRAATRSMDGASIEIGRRRATAKANWLRRAAPEATPRPPLPAPAPVTHAGCAVRQDGHQAQKLAIRHRP